MGRGTAETATTCVGTAVLVALKTQRVHGVKVARGTVLARTTYRVAAGKVVQLKLRPTRAGKRVLTATSLKRATLTVGGQSRTVKLRR